MAVQYNASQLCSSCAALFTIGGLHEVDSAERGYEKDVKLLHSTAAAGCPICLILVDRLDLHMEYYSIDPSNDHENMCGGYPLKLDHKSEELISHIRFLSFGEGGGRGPESARKRINNTGEALDDAELPLIVKFYVEVNNPFSSLNEPFTIYAEQGDPAARLIRSRPVPENLMSETVLNDMNIWLKDCLHNHPECSGGKIGSPQLPKRVLDVQSSGDGAVRLRHTSGERGQYAALSYCWGSHQEVVTTKSTLRDMCTSVEIKDLPLTIQDAIESTRCLDLKFLWVDALCILQDDDGDMDEEIKNMGEIYKNATITIYASVAACASEGFLRHPSRKSEKPLLTIPLAMPDGSIGNIMVTKKQSVGVQALDKRGWAFQEWLLSPRRLSYNSCEAIWGCGRAKYTAAAKSSIPEYEWAPAASQLMLIDIQNSGKHFPGPWSTWSGIVKQYTERTLTFPDDRLSALLGIATQLESAWNTRYVYGLWHSSLGELLIWEPKSPLKSTIRSPRAPSWSWACLDVPIDFRIGPFIESDGYKIDDEVKNCTMETSKAGMVDGAIRCHIKVVDDVKSKSMDSELDHEHPDDMYLFLGYVIAHASHNERKPFGIIARHRGNGEQERVGTWTGPMYNISTEFIFEENSTTRRDRGELYSDVARQWINLV